MGKQGDEQNELKPWRGSGVLPWKNLIPGSSNWLKTTLIFVSQYRLTSQVNLFLDVRMALV